MDTARERRDPGTEDAVHIPKDVVLDGTVDGVMAQRADDCQERGHRWHDKATREICVHCGASWGRSPE